MNEFSRRYKCPECGFKGRASRERVNEANGIMTCAVCRSGFLADPLFRGSVDDEERDRKRNESNGQLPKVH